MQDMSPMLGLYGALHMVLLMVLGVLGKFSTSFISYNAQIMNLIA